jgi:autotransporter passenger strand-loop-strand repeat protein
VVDGVASGTTIDGGGTEIVAPGARVIGTIVSIGGLLKVLSGGIAIGTTLEIGSGQTLSGYRVSGGTTA